jgi:hypothetical protein
VKYRAVFNTGASVAVDIDVPDDVIAENTYDGEVDELALADWAAEKAHDIVSEEIDTWGTGFGGRARLDMSIDGIGADCEKVTE